ncbi:MAG: pgeF [Bacteroidetes bacterium]|jgi:YfiH family protein|nr:pgeF [Bacteroidota bacterium]
MLIIPKIFDSSKVIAAQSTRQGGVSPAPYSSLNLGMSVKDNQENVLKNRELFFGKLGIDPSHVTKSHQVHGNHVLVVDEPVTTEGYDSLITNKPGVFLVVSIADCTPILIHDEKNNAVAAIHAGWRGTAGKIVSNTLALMKKNYGTEGEDCKAFIGACISYKNFEVGDEVAENFEDRVKRFDEAKHKWFVDLKSANSLLLEEAGVLRENIEPSNYCTVDNNDLFFSHRKEKGVTGRMMAVIGIKKSNA